MKAIVRGGKWSSIEPHFLSIAQLDWTIKQKRQNRNMGYVLYVLALSVNVRQVITVIHNIKRQNRNMGYECVFALLVKCEASHKVDFLYNKSWYGARRDCKIINNAFILETVSSAKNKRSRV